MKPFLTLSLLLSILLGWPLTAQAQQRYYKLYTQDGTFAGNTKDQYDPNSINNPYGQYGSRYSPKSLMNPYSRVGRGNRLSQTRQAWAQQQSSYNPPGRQPSRSRDPISAMLKKQEQQQRDYVDSYTNPSYDSFDNNF